MPFRFKLQLLLIIEKILSDILTNGTENCVTRSKNHEYLVVEFLSLYETRHARFDSLEISSPSGTKGSKNDRDRLSKCLLIEGIFLAVVLQLHAAALSSLRSEVAELNARLVAETRAREATEAALVRAELQAARAEQKVEQQAARHEERLTELHSVIAELGRQLERHRATVIAEEDESGKGEKREPIPSTCATTVSISLGQRFITSRACLIF